MMKMSRGLSFFLTCPFLFETTEIYLGNQNGQFLPEKSIFHTGKKIGKSDLAPSEKYSSYATGLEYLSSLSTRVIPAQLKQGCIPYLHLPPPLHMPQLLP